MKINVQKVVQIYAIVTVVGHEFRVFPNGNVSEWNEEDGVWVEYSDCEDLYDEVKSAGLGVLNDTTVPMHQIGSAQGPRTSH